MVQRVFGRAFELCRNPAYLLPALLLPCLMGVLPRILTGPPLTTPPRSLADLAPFFVRTFVSLVIPVVFAWPSMTSTALAIGLLRGESTSYFDKWVDFGVFIRAFLVDIVRVLVMFIGGLLFLVPGIFVAVVWSQTQLLLIDGRSQFFDALEGSQDLTRGSRGEVFLVFLALMIVLLLGITLSIGLRRVLHRDPFSWLGLSTTLLWSVPFGAVSNASFAALYLELLKTVPQLTRADLYLAPPAEPLPH